MPQSVALPYQPSGMGAMPGMPQRPLDRPPVVHERGSTSIYAPPRKFGPRGPLRKGKWTPEEEVYAHFIIDAFNKGLIDLPRGTTLRSYLSEQLNCDPMRVTKKFAGTSSIGKSVFCPCVPSPENLERMKEVKLKIAILEQGFRAKVESTSTTAAMHLYMQQQGLLHNPTFPPPPAPIRMPMQHDSAHSSRSDLTTLSHLSRLSEEIAQIEHVEPLLCTPKPSAAAKRRRGEDDSLPLNDHDAGDLLLNFFSAVHRSYATDDDPMSGGSEGNGAPSPHPSPPFPCAPTPAAVAPTAELPPVASTYPEERPAPAAADTTDCNAPERSAAGAPPSAAGAGVPNGNAEPVVPSAVAGAVVPSGVAGAGVPNGMGAWAPYVPSSISMAMGGDMPSYMADAVKRPKLMVEGCL